MGFVIGANTSFLASAGLEETCESSDLPEPKAKIAELLAEFEVLAEAPLPKVKSELASLFLATAGLPDPNVNPEEEVAAGVEKLNKPPELGFDSDPLEAAALLRKSKDAAAEGAESAGLLNPPNPAKILGAPSAF